METQSHTGSAPLRAVIRIPENAIHNADGIAILPPPTTTAPVNFRPWPHTNPTVLQEIASTRRKRILLITADGEPGGGVTNVLQLCRSLRDEDSWHITVCSQTGSYAIQQARTICNEVHEIDFFTSRFDPRVMLKLRKLVSRISPDLIHTHGSRAALPATFAVSREGPPIIHTVHGFHFYRKSPLSRLLAIKAERSIIRRADKTIFVCDNDEKIAHQEKMIRESFSSIRIHHGINGCDLPQKVAHTRPTVVMLARLVPQKQPEMMIEIADLLRDSGICFQFIGDGELEAKLKSEVALRRLEGVVEFMGKHSREDALKLASSADLAILPSLWEGFPIALLELLGMGIPVIASSVNGIPEIVKDGWNGFLVEERNARMYADRILWLIQNPALRSAFARNACNSVADNFSESRMTAEHIAVYRNAIAVHAHVASMPRLSGEWYLS